MENELTERMRLEWSQDYRRQFETGECAFRNWNISRINPRFYSINITPKEHLIHGKGIWYDIDQRERYLDGIWTYLKHSINRFLHNNYLRKPHLQIQHQVVIEHYDKKTKELIKPHIHGTLAVPSECNERFKTLLIEVSKGVYTLDLDRLKGDFSLIKSTHVERIYDMPNLFYWMGYTMKQQLKGDRNEDKQGNERGRYPQDESVKGFWSSNR